MASKLYVGNLSFSVTSSDLEKIFGEFGQVEDATVITDRQTGRSKGFGFVTFSSDEDAQAAIEATNGKDISGRPATVNVAKPREDRPSRGGGGYGNRDRRY